MTTSEGELEVGLDKFDMSKHDGVLTLVSPKSGKHRTFKISTVRKGTLEGKRVVALLRGPDNENDYVGFGFVVEGSFAGVNTATVNVWKKFKAELPEQPPTIWQRFADLLNRPSYWASRGVEYKIALHCRRCFHLLTHPESIESGYGPECIKKVGL